MKMYIKNRIMPMIFKQPPTYENMQIVIVFISLLMIVIIGNGVKSLIVDFRTNNIDDLHVKTYNACRVNGMLSTIDENGEHVRLYTCQSIIDVDGERDETLIVHENEIFTDYTHIGQKIRVMREPTMLSDGLPYTEYYRTYRTNTP